MRRNHSVRAQRRGVWKIWSLLLVLALVFAACGGDDDDDESGSGEETTTEEGQQGGTAIMAVEQEPTGLNWQNAEDNAAWTQYIMGLVWPGTYIADPTNEREI